jgi:hypothetical protein
MSTNPDPDDPLNSLFERSRELAPEPSERLESMVWRRLASIETPVVRRGWLATIEAVFARPSFTAAFVVGCILLGLFLAETRVSQLQARRSAQFVQSYLREIDPQLDQAGSEKVSVSLAP